MNIPYPFSLINNNVHKNRLEVLPAFYWMHNIYALERNSWKTKNRDRRKEKIQRFETDYLAPDTAEEIINAITLLEKLLSDNGLPPDLTDKDEKYVHEIPCQGIEHSKREQVIIKPYEALTCYRRMLRYYAVKTFLEFADKTKETEGCSISAHNRVTDWVNIGGQIVPAFRLDELRKDINEGKIKTWDEIHRVYASWDESYQLDKCTHAWAVLFFILEVNKTKDLKKELDAALEIRNWIETHIKESRVKDYSNPFKKATFRNTEEMEQVLGKVKENPFILIVQKETAAFREMIERAKAEISYV